MRPILTKGGQAKKRRARDTAAHARRAQILEGMMLGQTRVQIATQHGFSPGLVHKVCGEPDFQEKFKAALEERRRAMHMRLEAMAQTALKTHLEVMQENAHRDRLRAAESILDRAGASRVAKVEQSGTTMQIDAGAVAYDELEGKSLEELDHFAKTGRWPPKIKAEP